MNSLNLIKCTHCDTPLRLQRGATTIRYGMCDAVNLLGDPRTVAGVPPPQYHPTTAPTNRYTDNYYPPPPQPSPVSYAPSPVVYGGKKKAVIVGIVYKNTESELRGSINDANRMKNMLVNRFKFPESSIYMLTAMSKVTPNGAMTFALIKAIEEGQGTTYGNLLNSIRSIIYQFNQGLYPENKGFGSNRIGITQEAQHSANERFDVYSKPFSL